MDTIDVIKNGGDGATKLEIVAAALAFGLFTVTIYAAFLSIKTNNVLLKKLASEGFK